MPDLISPDARQPVATAEAGDLDPALAATLLPRLQRELAAPRRLLVGAGAFLLGLVGSIVVAVGVAGAADGTDPIALLLVGLVGVTLLAGAAALGVWVVLTGRRVARAHRRCSAQAPTATPAGTLAFLLSGRELLRAAIAAAGILLLLFSITLVYLAAAPSDPADLGDGRTASLVIGLGWAVCAAVPTIAVGLGTLRSGTAAGRRLGRWSEARRAR